MTLPQSLGLAELAKCISFTLKFYMRDMALSGELSYVWTGLVLRVTALIHPEA